MPPDTWRGLLPESIEQWTDPAYHYTSPGGLLGVLENQELWATEATGMNDVAEIRQGWDFIRDWLAGYRGDDPALRDVNGAFGIVRQEDSWSQISTTFMCCASTERDDANQWRLYANSGSGYVIELDTTEKLAVRGVRKRTHATVTPSGEPTWSALLRDTVEVSPWLKVLYKDCDKRQALDGFLANSRAFRDGVLKELPDSTRSEAEAEFQVSLVAGLEMIAQLMKSRGFAGENEVRTVVSFVNADDHISYRATDYGVVRHARLISRPVQDREESVAFLDKEHPKLPVRSVGLGPLLSAQNNKVAIERLLLRGGNPPEVWHSQIPLRGRPWE